MPTPTANPPPAPRPAVLAAGVAAVLAVGGLMLARFYADPAFLPPDDFLQYWAAGRLHATGGNPYDADQLLPLQRSAGRPEEKPAVVMWNPPWALTLATPFGLLSPRTAQLLWLVLQVLAVVVCADRLWRLYRGEPRARPLVCVGALAFFPVMCLLHAGQSSGWLLLGLTGLLLAATRGPAWLAVFAPLAAVKPHLFVPVWVVLALEAGRTRRGFAVFAWGVGCGLLMVLLPTLVNPDVWGQYFAAMDRPADESHVPLSGWKSPLIGWWVRTAVKPEAFWIQAVPTAVLIVAVPVYWWVRRRTWDWAAELPRLVLAGLIAAAYGAWPYDQLVLLIPVAAALAHLTRKRGRLVAAGVVLGAVNAAGFVIREGESFVWVPPAVLAWYVWATTAGRIVPVEAAAETTQLAQAGARR